MRPKAGRITGLTRQPHFRTSGETEVTPTLAIKPGAEHSSAGSRFAHPHTFHKTQAAASYRQNYSELTRQNASPTSQI